MTLLRSHCVISATVLWVALTAQPATAAEPGPLELESGRRALLEGSADLAVSKLQGALTADPHSGEAHLLLCRVWLSEGMDSRAATECQAALANGLDHNSDAQDWTGRALGAVAEHAGMLSGLKLALEVRSAFETAAQLDPASEAANVDLGEYYTSAPAIVGGGNTKALALAARIQPALPAVSHRIRAMAAEHNKDFGTAEREFQAEAGVAHSPGALVDLAAFYERRQNSAKAIEVAHQILAADRQVDASVVEAANVLEHAHQTSDAERALRSYLEHGTKSDVAPAFRVYTDLGRLQASNGQTDAARQDFQRALALASAYGPAQKGLSAL